MGENFGVKHTLTPTLALFASAGTLVCCALPALFVSLGMGAALAGLVGNFPALVWLSQYKLWVFALSGALILLSAIMMYRARNLPCPVDAAQARACARLRKISLWILGISGVSYLIGFFFAFIAPRIFF